MRKTLLFILLLCASPVAARAGEHVVRYVGIHPIAAEYGGGFCYIEFPHVHVYQPAKAEVLYRQTDDGYYFVGDPVPYGYEGPKQAYYGPHPIHVDYVLGEPGDEVEYCYIQGPHYHSFAPSPTATFKMKGGVYFYAGDFPRAYVVGKPRLGRINAIYRPLHYSRPVVVAAPPPEYRGPVYVDEEPTVIAPATVGVGVGVHAEAGIGIHAGVGAGVVVGAPVVVEPAPTVVVRERPTTYVIERRPAVQVIEVREKRHHDRGRHKGWGKRWHD